jgi:hypothetical protein
LARRLPVHAAKEGRDMRYITTMAICVALLGACSKTDDGRIVVHSPGEVDVKTRADTITLPKITLPKVNLPKVETKEETVIVKKPVMKRDTTKH